MTRQTEKSLARLGDLAIDNILSMVGPKGTALLACAGKSLRDWASDESLWSKFCFDELQLDSPIDHLRNPCPNFKAAYQAWREAFSMYHWPLVQRVNRCWNILTTWLATNFPEALATLRQGASEIEIDELENSLGVKVPIPMRVLYRFYDGQNVESGSQLGLIGGYSYYEFRSNVSLLTLNKIITETRANLPHIDYKSNFIVIARSYSDRYPKIFFLDCNSGKMHISTRRFSMDGKMMHCVPSDFVYSDDDLLLWLEEHGRRLHDGIIKTRVEDGQRCISLFPEEAPLCSTAITHGIKVRASAVFMAEGADPEIELERYMFAYSIRISLLPSFNSCQLERRKWIFYADDEEVQRVDRGGVLGQYPILNPGEDEYVYQSWACQPSVPGSMRGSFAFVPGRIDDRAGDSFEVEVAPVPLLLPDYIF